MRRLPPLRPDLLALTLMLLLALGQFLGLGVLGPKDAPQEATRALLGFGQPLIFTLIGLFILTQALSHHGFSQWIGERLARLGARSEVHLLILFTSLAALLSLFMNNVVVGAILLPGAIQAARKLNLYPSKLLIPIAFGTALGGMATYFTTANIVFSNLLLTAQPPQHPLNMATFLSSGGWIALIGIVYLLTIGRRLLPERRPVLEQALARRSEADLERLYALGERLWEVKLGEHSPLIGKTLAQSGLGDELGLAVIAIWRGRRAILVPEPTERLQRDDLLLLVGRESRVLRLRERGCSIGRETRPLSSMEVTLLEVLPSPHASTLGKTLKQINFRRRYGFTAVALLRRGRSIRTDVGDYPLELGDALLIVGPSERIVDLRRDAEWIVLEAEPTPPETPGRKALITLALFLIAIFASLLGLPAYLAVMAAALLTPLLRLLSIEEFYRAIEWPTLFFLGSMYAVSLAIVQSGLATSLLNGMLQIFPHPNPLVLSSLAFWISALLTQILGSQTTAFITGPILIHAALHLGYDPRAVALAGAIGCSASFLTPISHPINLLMLNPGNYRFGDFARVGAGLLLVTFATLILVLYLFWGIR
ncbi:MAG: SLC13 family permease [Anaerolineales bacterium]